MALPEPQATIEPDQLRRELSDVQGQLQSIPSQFFARRAPLVARRDALLQRLRADEPDATVSPRP